MGLLLIALIFWTMPPLSASARRQMGRWSIRIGIAALLLILLRLGLPWLAVIGTAVVAVLRFAMPLLIRLLPLWLLRRAHALDVLDLAEGASRDEILKAYKDLIKKVHPDRGGSSYLAAEVNRARDVLLSDDSK